MTLETKNIIENQVDKLLDEIAESTYIGLCETMSPNDIEFSSTYQELLDEAQYYIIQTIQGV